VVNSWPSCFPPLLSLFYERDRKVGSVAMCVSVREGDGLGERYSELHTHDLRAVHFLLAPHLRAILNRVITILKRVAILVILPATSAHRIPALHCICDA
jgi:hypothetical protein